MSDTFNTSTPKGYTWNLNGVAVRVNGESVGSAQATDTLAATVQRFASAKGIRSASVFANGDRKLFTTDGSKTLQELGVTELNVVTKDQRAVWVI